MTTATTIDSVVFIQPQSRFQVVVSASVIYAFSYDPGNDLVYYKSSDGGLTWSAPVAVTIAASASQWVDVYYERWNSPTARNRVHFACSRDAGTRGIYYNYLDLDTDTLGTYTVVVTMGGHPGANTGSIGVARDGTIRIDSSDFLGVVNGYYSTDDGATWTSAGNAIAEVSGWQNDRVTMWADFAGDPEDICALYFDASAQQYSVKRWDKSANTITETVIGTAIAMGGSALNHLNGHIYLAAYSASGVLSTWDVHGATVTARGTVYSGTFTGAGVAPTIDSLGRVRVYYTRDRSAASATSLEVLYKTSNDGMATWGAEAVYSSIDGDIEGIYADPAPAVAIAPLYEQNSGDNVHAALKIETPLEVLETNARLQLSDGADPDVATIDITAGAIGSTIIKVERGRESAVLGMPSRAGQATTRLNNQGLGYGMDEPVPGLALRLNKKYSGTWYHLWHGNLDIPQHTMTGWRPVVDIRALGPLTKLAQRKVSTPLYKNVTTGAAIGYLLDAAGFPATARDLDAGDVTLAYWWCNDEDALTALWKIVDSEGITAELYESGAGELVFRSRTARYTESRSTSIQTTFRSFGANPLFNTFEYTAGYREIINAASHDRYRRTDDTAPSVVWEDVPDFYYIVPPNGFIEVLATAQEPFFDAITPAAGTDFSYGFDSPTVTLERTSGQRTKIRFTSGAAGTTLTGLQLRATKTINNATYAEVNTVDASASIAAYGLRPWGGSMSKELDFATMRDNLDGIVNWKQSPRGRVRFSINAAQSAEANQATAQREIGDRVRVIESELGFDGECWIERIEHEVHAPAGPADGSAVGSEVTTFECSVISVASGSTGTGLGEDAPYTDNSVYVGTDALDDYGIATMGASIF